MHKSDRSKAVRKEKLERRRRKRQKKRIVIIIIVLIIGTVIRLNIKEYTERGYKLYETNITLPIDRLSRGEFVKPDVENFYYVTKNKIALYDSKATKKWEYIYSFNSVSTYNRGNYIAVYEFGSKKSIYVYNEKGYKYDYMPEGDIENIKINKNGYTVISSITADERNIVILNSTGVEIFIKKENSKKNVLLDVDISENNEVLGMSYLNLDYIKPQTEISFQGVFKKDNEKGVFSSLVRENRIVSKIVFVENDLYGISENEVEKFEVTNSKVYPLYEIHMPNVVEEIKIVNNKYIAILYGNKKMNETSFKENTIILYRNGKIKTKIKLEDKVEFMEKGIDSIIVSKSNEVINYDLSGNIIWTFENKGILKKFILLNKKKGLSVRSEDGIIVEKRK